MAGTPWKEEEVQLLTSNYPEKGAGGCALLLGRTEKSINIKASRLGLKYSAGWTTEKLEFLVKNYTLIGLTKCAEILNMEKYKVQSKAQTLGITSKVNKWSEEDLGFLKENYSKLGPKECANKLGRKLELVRNKAYELKITNPISYEHLTDEDLLDLVREYKLHDVFSYTEYLPSPGTILKRFNKNSWYDILELAGIPTNIKKVDLSGKTIFYILEFLDIDGVLFKKYGVTQSSIKSRYKNRLDYKVLTEKLCDTYLEAIALEKEIGLLVNKYKPKDRRFYSTGHNGYTECFISYINVPEWIDRG